MRKKILLNDGWKFHLGDIPAKEIQGHYETYMHSKARNGVGAAMASFYDQDFKDVRLPHDYVLEGRPDKKFNESQGSLERKNAWYRRHFKLPFENKNKRIILLFDGAGQQTTVWCNGCLAGENKSLYNTFYMDITPYIFDDEINTISVHIQNEEVEGWWYEGAGIYRNVWMLVTDDIAVDVWGTYVNPILTQDDLWNVQIETTVWNNTATSTKVKVLQTIIDASGAEIKSTENEIITAYSENILNQTIKVQSPKLWDTQEPNLYKLITKTFVGDKITDEYETTFGFRTIKYEPATGFYLNGKSIKQRGVSAHYDHGNIGVALPETIHKNRVKNLKEFGFNAFRSSHNPVPPGFLDICDKNGVMVMEENRWFNWSDKSQKEIITMLKNGRNHPSVVVWSIGNEEPSQDTELGGRLVEHINKLVKKYDITRPVTLALNGGYYNSVSAEKSDVVGINHNVQLYPTIREAHPTKPIIATETGGGNGTRGCYFEKIGGPGRYKNDLNLKSAFAASSNCIQTIEGVEKYPYMSGTYIWNLEDYRGEAQWPKLVADSGFSDGCGFAKDNSYLVKSFWTNKPMVHIFPSWSLQGREGEPIKLYTYTNADQVEVIVNGESLGIKDYNKYDPLKWDTVYQPGCIEAIAYKNGVEIARDKSVTCGEAKTLKVENVFEDITNSGEDVAILKLYLEDENGLYIPTSDSLVEVEILDEKDGEIISVANGDPLSHADFKSHNQKMFNGLLEVLVRIKEGAKQIGIKANIPEKDICTKFTLDIKDVEVPFERIEGGDRDLSIDGFKIWPTGKSFEDVDETYNFDDMNSNEFIHFNNYEPDKKLEYLLFTSRAVFPETERHMNLIFSGVKGEFEIKVYHDEKAWPNPQPPVDITIKQHHIFTEKTDHVIPLDGFSSYEKMKIIMVAKNDGNFSLDNVLFSLK
ncbi:MAG: glycoside hydrolase family 2 TIM barrel-domain containing protein [Clostridia bacterium]